jgi:hypothetical protein
MKAVIANPCAVAIQQLNSSQVLSVWPVDFGIKTLIADSKFISLDVCEVCGGGMTKLLNTSWQPLFRKMARDPCGIQDHIRSPETVPCGLRRMQFEELPDAIPI